MHFCSLSITNKSYKVCLITVKNNLVAFFNLPSGLITSFKLSFFKIPVLFMIYLICFPVRKFFFLFWLSYCLIFWLMINFIFAARKTHLQKFSVTYIDSKKQRCHHQSVKFMERILEIFLKLMANMVVQWRQICSLESLKGVFHHLKNK